MLDKIEENLIEIVWKYNELESEGRLMSRDEISEEFSLCTSAPSDLLKEDFCEWADEFEKVVQDDSNDYLEEIDKFATEKILNKYGKRSEEDIKDSESEDDGLEEERDYYVSYSGSNVVRAITSDEACELALDQIDIDEINAYPMNEDGEIDLCGE